MPPRLVRSDDFAGSVSSSASSPAGSRLAVLLRLRPDRLGGPAASSSSSSVARLAVLLRLRLDLSRTTSAGRAASRSSPGAGPGPSSGESRSDARRATDRTTSATSRLPPEARRDDDGLLSMVLLRLPLPADDRL